MAPEGEERPVRNRLAASTAALAQEHDHRGDAAGQRSEQ